jgi:sugar fermentation stimulation protein A
MQARATPQPSPDLWIPHRRGAPTIPGVLLERPNRFLGIVRLEDGTVVEAHIADRGRLEEILAPGAEVRLAPADGAKRRTAFTLLLSRSEGVWVCIDPAGANHLVAAVLEARRPPLPAVERFRAEVRWERSRFDFSLELDGGRSMFLEVKSAGAAADGVALFPDAPSVRAARHCHELAGLASAGQPCMIALVAQRGDAQAIAPHPVDPAFAAALAEAREAGVEVVGLGFTVEERGFSYRGELPVLPHARG